MPAKWSQIDEQSKHAEIYALYVVQNKTIGEIAAELHIGQSTVYDRLKKFKIPSLRHRKDRYNNRRTDLFLPKHFSSDLAEFVGILLGDGHINTTQVTVTLGSKDQLIPHIRLLVLGLFGIPVKVMKTQAGHSVVYVGSTRLVRWLLRMGLVFNKVRSQVDVPGWIWKRPAYRRAVLRGLFDTDGSIYRLRSGLQISFCNRSLPLLQSVHVMLQELGFHPSRISGFNIYITRRIDLQKFFHEIGFKNEKHLERAKQFGYSFS